MEVGVWLERECLSKFNFIYAANANLFRNEIHYRTHLLPFTRCDRGVTQQIPIIKSLAHLIWTPDSTLNFAILVQILDFCAVLGYILFYFAICSDKVVCLFSVQQVFVLGEADLGTYIIYQPRY